MDYRTDNDWDIDIHCVGSIRSYVQINVSFCGNSDKLLL